MIQGDNFSMIQALKTHRVKIKRKTYKHGSIAQNWQLYVLMLLPMLWLLIFRYMPMYGAQIAFRDYNLMDGFWNSPWVGLKHFKRFLGSYVFLRVFTNTLAIAAYQLIVEFPIPILLAIALHHSVSKQFKSTVQMVSYAPHFISTVVLVGMLLRFLSTRGGIINNLIGLFGFEAVSFMGQPEFFKTIFVLSGVWQHTGYGAIVFLAALSGIDPELHEAAIVDGATKWQRIWHIDFIGLLPTAIIMLILRTGRILNLGFEKILLMQNPLNLSASEVIQTYVYKVGIASDIQNFSYATAVGLFRSVIGLVLILVVNRVAKRIGEVSLW
jgi:putative aldouronate transport system permease protein